MSKIQCLGCNGYGLIHTCRGTGEMIGNSEQLKSRSVQRREALQKGEPMPEFDKPEMPTRNKQFGADLIYVDDFGWNDNGHDLTPPILLYVKDSFIRDNYLPTDKVRELVKVYEDCLEWMWQHADIYIKNEDEWDAVRKNLTDLAHALFPEGMESEVKDE
jgi:hypothetical protein